MKKIISVILLFVMLILTTSCGDIEVIRTKLSYDQDLLEICVGDEINITPNCNKEDVVINYSLTSDIVSVDENGNLKALEKGTVIVEASVNKRDSVSAKLVIVVNESKTFTIYYDVNGGNPFEQNKVTYNSGDVITLPTPQRNGYKFLGWYENEELVTSLDNKNHTLKAMWEKLDIYTISYELNGGTFNVEAKYEFVENEVFTLPKPTKSGCIFLGWYENDKEITTLDNKNYNLVAKWYEINTDLSYYTITYNTNGGTLPTDTITSFDDCSKVVLPEPVRKGYKFLGWYENSNLITSLANKNYSLIAKWEELEKYHISYDLDGGELLNPINTYTKDDIFVLEKPIKEGYEFIGWITDKNKEPVKELEIKNQTSDLFIKAIYQPNTYKIVFKSNNQEIEIDIEYNETIKLTELNLKNSGMKLIGWNTEKELNGTTYILNTELTYTFTENIELYAVWTSLINLELNSSEKVLTDLPIITKGQKEFTLPIPNTKEFLFFVGWYLGEQQITDETGKNLKPWEFDTEVTLTPKWTDTITINNIKYYYLGEYPQTKVTNKETIKTLNERIPNYLGYCELDGEYYAKVVYDKNETVYFNDGEKAVKGETYYFKVEKVLWRMLDEKNNIVITEYVLDALSFYDSDLERKKYDARLDLNERIYQNDFSESNLNKYLNDSLVNRYDLENTLKRINYENEGFKSRTFGGSKKITDYIENTLRIDNSEASTLIDDNLYSVIDTSGYFYPLSHKEFKNTYVEKLNKVAYATDYAIVKGVECQKTATNSLKAASYWLRSPYYKSAKEALYININGIVSNTLVTNEKIGLRVACKKVK